MNYLFLLVGNDSYYEAFIMSKLVEQMDDSSLIVCFTGLLQSTYFSQNPKIYSVLLNDDIEINKENFEKTLEVSDISTIIIFDFHKAFKNFDDNEKKEVLFDFQWLENLDIPIAVIDYLDIFDYDFLGRLYLKNSESFIKEEKKEIIESDDSEEQKEEIENDENNLKEIVNQDKKENDEEVEENEEKPTEEKIKDMISPYSIYPKIIKLCPPNIVNENTSNNFNYLNFNYINLYPDRELEKIKELLGVKNGIKNIVLIFSYQMLLRSYCTDLKLLLHYSLVTEAIINYLKTLNINANLFIIGSELKYESEKIKVTSYKTINHDLYNTLMNFADLFIVDTTWHPALIDASNLQIPIGVIGNSLTLKEDNSLKANFSEIDEDIYNKMQELIKEKINIFYPYTSFPLKVDEFPEWGIYENKFLYYLLDIYDVENMLSFLGQFLIENEELKDVNENLKKVQKEYLNRAKNALSLEELLNTLIKDAK